MQNLSILARKIEGRVKTCIKCFKFSMIAVLTVNVKRYSTANDEIDRFLMNVGRLK